MRAYREMRRLRLLDARMILLQRQGTYASELERDRVARVEQPVQYRGGGGEWAIAEQLGGSEPVRERVAVVAGPRRRLREKWPDYLDGLLQRSWRLLPEPAERAPASTTSRTE